MTDRWDAYRMEHRARFQALRDQHWREGEQIYRKAIELAKELHWRRLTYRCRGGRGCLLLDVIETPSGVLMHQNSHKFAEPLNAVLSNADGRAANTSDGDRHWRAQTYRFETSALSLVDTDGAHQELRCDHYRGPLTAQEFERDWQSRSTRILLPRV